jgi:hypothetical protein
LADAEAAAGVDKLKAKEIHVSTPDDPPSPASLLGETGAKGSILIPIRVTVYVTCTY